MINKGRNSRQDKPALWLGLLLTAILFLLLFQQHRLSGLITKQNDRMDIQIALQEAERRSTLVLLFSNVMDAMDKELKEPSNTKRELSPQLVGRIVSLSQRLQPYRFMDIEGDSLTRPLSPERGQLLVNLVESGLDTSVYDAIFSRGDFSYAKLDGADLKRKRLRRVNLRGADLRRAELGRAKLEHADFWGADLERANLGGAYLRSAKLGGADFGNANLGGTDLWNVDLRDAELRGAELRGADWRDAYLSNAKFDTTAIPFLESQKIDLSEIKFYDENGERYHHLQ